MYVCMHGGTYLSMYVASARLKPRKLSVIASFPDRVMNTEQSEFNGPLNLLPLIKHGYLDQWNEKHLGETSYVLGRNWPVGSNLKINNMILKKIYL